MAELLKGNIKNVSLFNLLQLVGLEQKTCCMKINIKELQQEAKFFFYQGVVSHAEVNLIQGSDAVHRVLSWWDKGEFILETIEDDEIETYSIESPLEEILNENTNRANDLVDLKEVVKNIETKMSFSNEAIFEIQNSMNLESPDWVPAFMTNLPITFSLAKFFEVCPYDEVSSSNSLKYMLSSGILYPHEKGGEIETDSAIESLASIIMEYLGYDQTQGLVSEACESLQLDPSSELGFNQLLAFSDYVKERITEVIDEEQAQEIEWRLRARVTSLA